MLVSAMTYSAVAQTTEFTFQGKLNDSGTPVSSPRDLRFRLWSAETGGSQVGSDVIVTDVAFAAGIFTVRIDFGEAAFTGEPRWIETHVSQPGTGVYITLQPRQSLGSSPYAIKSLNSAQAEFANTAQNSNLLDGISSKQFVQTVDSRLSDARNPLPGSASYVQNQNAAPQASTNFNISGTGVANILRAETQFNIGTSRVFHSPGTNLFVGRSTGTNFTTGLFNTVVGGTAGNGMNNVNANSIFGSGAGFDNHGSENSLFGMNAGQANQNGGGNSFFGKEAGAANLDGSRNSFFGIGTGAGNTIGNDLTLLGSAANVGADGLNFATAIGSGSVVSTSDTVVIGKAAGTYNGVARVADTVVVPGTVNALTQYNLKGARMLGTGGNPSFPTVFVGPGSGASLTASAANNSFFGYLTGELTSSGTNNAFFGTRAGRTNSTGSSNSYFGSFAGFNATGDGNSLFGTSAGLQLTTGSNNTYVGSFAGQDGTTTINNAFFGAGSGSSSTGNFNAFFGSSSGGSAGAGNRNTMVGASSQFFPGSSGDQTTLVGYTATALGTGLTNATAIGAYSLVTQSNSLVLGGVAGALSLAQDTQVGIGTTAPKARLEVAKGDLLIGSPGQGIILKSPTGNTCAKLTIDDTPTFIGTIIPCP